MLRRHFLASLTGTALGYQLASFPFLAPFTATPLPAGFGLAYGPYRQHEAPDGLQPTEEEIREDLKLLKKILPEPYRIRVYSALGPGGLAAILAAEEGFLVTLGAWINEAPEKIEENEREVAALYGVARIIRPELVVVGNETVLRIDTNPDTNDDQKWAARERLKSYLRRAKEALPDLPLSTAESWATWTEDPAGAELVELVDLLTVHVHPFWESIPAEPGAPYVFQRLRQVQNRFGKPVMLGETGWPSAGNPEGGAIPNPVNQCAFIRELVCLAAQQENRVFLFSAFDEPFKGVADRGSGREAATEGITGAHWGVFRWNRRLKPWLQEIFGTPCEPAPASLLFRILARGALAPGFNLGLNTGMQREDWFSQLSPAEATRPDGQAAFRLTFPADQRWGSFFITTRRPTPDLSARRVTDLTGFDRLALDLRLMEGDDSVEVGLKTPDWPDDGTESKVVITGLSQEWQTAVIPLAELTPTDFQRLYVVCSLNFFGLRGKTVDFTELRFLPPEVPLDATLTVTRLTERNDLDPQILAGETLGNGYGLGAATADPQITNWIQPQPGFLRFAYPGERAWGAAFFTVGSLPPVGGQVLSTNWTGRTSLALELRGQAGGEVCGVGVRSRITPDYAGSRARKQFTLAQDWTWVEVPLTALTPDELKQITVVTALDFIGPQPQTVEVRNIRVC